MPGDSAPQGIKAERHRIAEGILAQGPPRRRDHALGGGAGRLADLEMDDVAALGLAQGGGAHHIHHHKRRDGAALGDLEGHGGDYSRPTTTA